MTDEIITYIVFTFIFSVLGYLVGHTKNRIFEGTILGACFGMIGIIILFFLKSKEKVN